MTDTPRPTLNFYCDESCHLVNDGHVNDGHGPNGRQVFLIGGLWCPLEHVAPASQALRALRVRHGVGPRWELKWIKASPSKLDLYLEALDLFFDDPDLHLRAAIVTDKGAFLQKNGRATLEAEHDDAYYRLYFDMLKVVLNPRATHNIYLDAKDTRGRDKIARLRDKLCSNESYAVPCDLLGHLQEIRSIESDLLQLADVLLGALSYHYRGLEDRPDSSPAKNALVARLRERAPYDLSRSTLHLEDKLNLWLWHLPHPLDTTVPAALNQGDNT